VLAGLRRIASRQALAVAIRFHLAPGISPTLTGDGAGALLRLPATRPRAGTAWSFRAQLPAGFRLAVEDSLVVRHDGAIDACVQLVVAGACEAATACSIGWALRRQGR
jgi:uncharacterized heparinase superfamily protein